MMKEPDSITGQKEYPLSISSSAKSTTTYQGIGEGKTLSIFDIFLSIDALILPPILC